MASLLFLVCFCKLTLLILQFWIADGAVLHLSDTLVCSMALTFFTHTEIFQSTGVSEIPADEILREVVDFTCPCILRIIENHIATGGVFVIPRT